ncbi:Hypothetical predicted protein [Paramuricea clavata]|uniref:Uncharacterized protein n=1 Tax=Paramuricea clavata TaxID=317549 RepID=A0A6S7KVP7_PARCT|nr:Hypothetical predicted protein [Paramuricea clavata]
MPPRPCKQLDSKRIEDSLRADILPLITEQLEAIACRAVWRVRETDIDIARNHIASKRLRLDQVISLKNGVLFFFPALQVSCVLLFKTISSSPVMCEECATCNEKILFSTTHDEELDAEVTRIRVRKSSDSNNEMEKAAKQLFQVVKDHSNNTIQEMLQISNAYCYKNSEGTPSDDDEEDYEPKFVSNHFPNVPCCIIVVNESEFGDRVATAVTKLESDGLVVDLGNACVVKLDNPPFSSNNDVAALINNIDKCMKLYDHALYRSEIYTKPEGSNLTFVKMMDVTSYLHKLLANEVLRDKLIQHFQAVDRLLSHPACAIIQ